MRTRKHLVVIFGGLLVLTFGCGEAGDDLPAPDASMPDTSTGDGPQKPPNNAKGNGQACSGNSQCKSLHCAGGKCAPGSGPVGKSCLHPEECASNKCVAGKCAPGGGLKPHGSSCAKGGECASTICYAGKCSKPCTKPGDCAGGQLCGSDDGKRIFCYSPKYNPGLGKPCGATGACPPGLTCIGIKYDWGAFCRATCSTDLDCPPAMECETSTDAKRYCRPRRMCSQCVHDGNCQAGDKCVAMLGGKFCTRACNPGSTECPMSAQCMAAGGGNFCQPKVGSCKGDGGICAACTKNDHCKAGGMCLSFSLSGENFCGAPCTSDAACGGNYKCYTVSTSTGQKQCGPKLLSGSTYPTCSSGITFPIFNVGDTIDDFAMVGYTDTNNDGTLSDETQLQVIKLSHLAKGAKLLLLNISAFW